jgi:hypothetical protein
MACHRLVSVVVLMVASRLPECTVLFGSVNAGVTGPFSCGGGDFRGCLSSGVTNKISAPPPPELKGLTDAPMDCGGILRDA